MPTPFTPGPPGPKPPGFFGRQQNKIRGGIAGLTNPYREAISGYAGTARGYLGTANRYLGQGIIGRSIREAALESVGYDISFSGRNKGFLGLREHTRLGPGAVGKNIWGGGGAVTHGRGLAVTAKDIYKFERFRGAGRVSSALTAARAPGALATTGKIAGKAALSGAGALFMAYEMYHGYKEGGVGGAIKAGAYNVATMAAFRLGVKMLGHPLTLGIAAVAAIGYGAYQLGEAGRAYSRRIRDLELGGDENLINAINGYGAASMRQRAATALSNSHINRRLALGNEATMFHSSYGR
jgi:hypothetical protein